MRKIVKCSINDIFQIKDVNALPVDGVEIQLLKNDNIFSLLDEVKLPIINFHYDLDNTLEDLFNCDLVSVMNNNFDNGHFDEVLRYADKYHANILLHMARNPLNEENLSELMNKVRNFTGKILLENAGGQGTIEPSEFSGICDALNFVCGEDKFVPILDICHFYRYYSWSIDGTPSLKEIIKMNRVHGNLYFHFNYGLGDCTKHNHSCTFKENVALMENLLSYIQSIDKNANLILEVYEESYNDHINARWMIEKINEICGQ